MSQIVLGKGLDGKPVYIDLKILLRTRGLVQAASGGGKSRTLRRMGEQFFGKVPTWIIDRDGEFPSLREKFGYVLVGKGGETPTDVRSAELVCQRLLEHRASAVFDLYNLKDPDRHLWVKTFLNALMNAPKNLWGDLVLMVDEAHRFAPEKDKSEALGAMVDVACDGRKHGICPIYFTQRLGKVTKNATAELLNRFVGKTLEDIDVDRAADLFGVRKTALHEFEEKLKHMEPGEFYCFGPAIAAQRTLVHVGGVQTTHPEPGSPSGAVPPPLPEKMKAILPKLADLPKQAEEEKRTVAELKAQVRALKVEASMAAKAAPAIAAAAPKTETKIVTKIETVKMPFIKTAHLKRLETLIAKAEGIIGKAALIGDPFQKTVEDLRGSVNLAREIMVKALAPPPAPKPAVKAPVPRVTIIAPFHSSPKPVVAGMKMLSQAGIDPLFVASNPQNQILRGLREFGSIGVHVVARPQLAAWLSKKVTGSYLNDLGALRSQDLIRYQGKGLVLLTEHGLRQAPAMEMEPTSDGIFKHLTHALSGPQGEILRVARSKWPEWISREAIAEELGKKITGSFLNDLGALRSAQAIEYGDGDLKSYVHCLDWMFVSAEAVA